MTLLIIIRAIIILAILAAIVYALVYFVGGLIAHFGLTKETKDPEAALDAVFNGADVATWHGSISGLSKPAVIVGAAARGYAPTAGRSGTLLVFTRVSAEVISGSRTKELDEAFNGEDIALWEWRRRGLSEKDVIREATARGYRLTAPKSPSGLMVFAKESADV